jgi:hypothetical protein
MPSEPDGDLLVVCACSRELPIVIMNGDCT